MRFTPCCIICCALLLATALGSGCRGILFPDNPKLFDKVAEGMLTMGQIGAGAAGYRTRTGEWPARAVDIMQKDYLRGGSDPLTDPQRLDERVSLQPDGDTLWVQFTGHTGAFGVVQREQRGDWYIMMREARH